VLFAFGDLQQSGNEIILPKMISTVPKFSDVVEQLTGFPGQSGPNSLSFESLSSIRRPNNFRTVE
jgi:hypothetical protein